jgi:hypothetical protein
VQRREHVTDPSPHPPVPPPRAFTQGLGQVFQVAGVVLFLLMMFICCSSSLLSKDFATKTTLTQIGWGRSSENPRLPAYSAQRALTICVFSGVFFGLALAGLGLGMQADSKAAPAGAVLTSIIGAIFWVVHALFAATVARSVLFTLIAAALACLFAGLLLLSIHSFKETRS